MQVREMQTARDEISFRRVQVGFQLSSALAISKATDGERSSCPIPGGSNDSAI